MRLTLRTMLAYLDEILDPADSKLLGQKIQDSKFASDLVDRIRAAMAKQRLGVPRLEGKGMGLDPNTVAEYLDSTLPPDRVPDFEKVCLESDVHLAEVAACHQVLTMVLGKPAEISSPLRERMYRVGVRARDGKSKRGPKEAPSIDKKSRPKADSNEGVVPPPKVSEAAARGGDGRSSKDHPVPREEKPRDAGASGGDKSARHEPPPAPVEKPAKPTPVVPDYLRAAHSRPVWPLLLIVLFAFVLVAVLLRAVGPFNQEHPLARLVLGDGQTEVAQQNTNSTSQKPPPRKTPEKVKPEEEDASAESPAKVVETDEDNPPAKTPKPADAVKPPPETPAETEPDPTPAKPLAEVDPVVKPKTPVEPAPPESPATPKAPAGGNVVGRFISDQQILARLDAKTGDWLRLPNDAPLSAGDRLITLPTYRPQITLISGVQLTIGGESLIEFLPPDDRGVAELRLEYGKLTVVSSGKPGAQIGLALGSRHGVVTFDDVDSVLAVEVRRFRFPGHHAEQVPPTVVVELFPAAGKIHWAETDGPTAALDTRQVLTYLNADPGKSHELPDQPEWVKGKSLSGIDKQASPELAAKLPVDRSLLLSLQERVELTKEARVEVRSLAIRSLMSLDEFEPYVTSLSDDKFKGPYWYAQFDAVQEALARGPQSAEQVRKAFEAARSEDAVSLYRILMGYDEEELKRSGAAKLVEYLEDDALDFRVLAFETLYRITGRSFSYRPENKGRLTTTLSRWKQDLREGKIVYKSYPTPLPERKELAKAAPAAKEPAKVPAEEPPGK